MLDLSGNLLPVAAAPALPFPALRHLVLGKMLHTGYTWDQVSCLAH